MILSVITQKHIEDSLGKSIRYPSDYEHLIFDVERVTKKRIGLNTIKRLFGAIESVKRPRLYTLDAIAEYIGYENWDVYIISMSKEGNSQFGSQEQDDKTMEILADNLQEGYIVEFQYFPDRVVEAEYLGGARYKVRLSHNSKLKVNDFFEAKGFYLNYPLIIQCVVREGINLGRFKAGEVSGLTHLKLKEK